MSFDYTWRWSLSKPSFYVHGQATFRYWKTGQPNRPYDQHCVTINSNGLWVSASCGDRCGSICSKVKGSNVDFVYIRNPMTWTQAQRYCRKHHTDLASVRYKKESERIGELVPPGDLAWIGLHKGPGKWMDGSQSPFRYWRDSTGLTVTFPKEPCVAADFNNSGRWETPDCSSKRASVCYSALTGYRKTVKVRLVKQSSSLDLNDPAVMEDILKQLRQKLKDQGVDGDVRLSWRKQPDGKVFHREEGRKEDELD